MFTIVNLNKFPILFATGGRKVYKGYAIANEDCEFLSLDGKSIYIPCGGRRALKELLPIADTFQFVPLH